MKQKFQKFFYWFLRVLLGLFLLASAIGKLLDVSGFVAIIKTYEVGLPLTLRWISAIGLIIAETMIGFWILSGWQTGRGALGSVFLNCGYLIFLSITLMRGIDVPNCGCFGVFLSRPLTLTTLIEDFVLILLSGCLYLMEKRL